MKEREPGEGHWREDPVLLWEIREDFMAEMAFDLNFAGRRVSHKWRRKVAKHVLCPHLAVSFVPAAPTFCLWRAHMCTCGDYV